MATKWGKFKNMNLFNKARINLTLFYLFIIMVISSSFSLVIYRGATMEINRIQMTQRLRRPAPNEFMIDPDLGPGLPIGFSNSIIKDVPLASMQGLIKKSKTQKYLDLSKENAYYLALQEAIKKGYIKN